MTLMDVAHDFAVVSILLAIGYFLRMKVKLFQRLFLPASIIGGLIGLIIGPQILGLYSPVHVTYTASISEWSGVLLAVTFACSFLGESMEKITKQAVAATLVGGVAHQAQAVLGMIVAFLFQSVVPIGFGLIPLFALYGGIGWSVPVATIFEEEGYWTNAVPVAITIATIGVVCGIVFGIVMAFGRGLLSTPLLRWTIYPRSSVPDTLPLESGPPLEAQCPNPHRWTRLPFSWPLWVLLSPVPFGSEIF